MNRSGLNQLVFAIEASFRQLERVFNSASQELPRAVEQWFAAAAADPYPNVLELVQRTAPPALRLTTLSTLLGRLKRLQPVFAPTWPRARGTAKEDKAKSISSLSRLEATFLELERSLEAMIRAAGPR